MRNIESIPVQCICAVTHARDNSIVLEVSRYRCLQCFVIFSCNFHSSTKARSKCFKYALIIYFNSINASRSKVSVQIIVEGMDFLRIHKANPVCHNALQNETNAIGLNPRRWNGVYYLGLILSHFRNTGVEATPVTYYCMPDVNIPGEFNKDI